MIIKGLDKAEILKAFYDASSPQGLGFSQATSRLISLEECREFLSKQTYFDYLKGKPLKIDLSGDTLDVRKYDKNNGKNLGKNLIRKLQIQKVKYLIKNYEEIDDKMKELEIQREKWREEIKEFKVYMKESK